MIFMGVDFGFFVGWVCVMLLGQIYEIGKFVFKVKWLKCFSVVCEMVNVQVVCEVEQWFCIMIKKNSVECVGFEVFNMFIMNDKDGKLMYDFVLWEK